MQPIIAPIDRNLLKQELNADRFVRNTNNGNNKIYIISHHDSPNVMLEIGRLREVTFRAAGGGTGKDCDLDHFDTDTVCYKQLIVLNEEEQEIVGGYRYIRCGDVIDYNKQEAKLATSLDIHLIRHSFCGCGCIIYSAILSRFLRQKLEYLV